jgi:hypothetical protein
MESKMMTMKILMKIQLRKVAINMELTIIKTKTESKGEERTIMAITMMEVMVE